MTDRQDGSTFDLAANISWTRQRYEKYTSSISDRTMPVVYWVNTIDALGRYNRSLTNHTDIHIAENESNETFIVKDYTSLRECYKSMDIFYIYIKTYCIFYFNQRLLLSGE